MPSKSEEVLSRFTWRRMGLIMNLKNELFPFWMVVTASPFPLLFHTHFACSLFFKTRAHQGPSVMICIFVGLLSKLKLLATTSLSISLSLPAKCRALMASQGIIFGGKVTRSPSCCCGRLAGCYGPGPATGHNTQVQ